MKFKRNFWWNRDKTHKKTFYFKTGPLHSRTFGRYSVSWIFLWFTEFFNCNRLKDSVHHAIFHEAYQKIVCTYFMLVYARPSSGVNSSRNKIGPDYMFLSKKCWYSKTYNLNFFLQNWYKALLSIDILLKE